jgi:O-glycosyl hydrolase
MSEHIPRELSGAELIAAHEHAKQAGEIPPLSPKAGCVSRREQLSVRVDPDDKRVWTAACEADGIDASTAARQVIELIAQRMRDGEGYIELLLRVKTALKPTVRVQAGRAP